MNGDARKMEGEERRRLVVREQKWPSWPGVVESGSTRDPHVFCGNVVINKY